VTETFVSWPTDILRPSRPLWGQVAERIAADTGTASLTEAADEWQEPEWKSVAPGISCKLLAADTERDRVTMLVRLAAGAHYPPHRHAGPEELHLLDGELWINDRKLHPGDYNRAEPDTRDRLVLSETGCTCVLMTSLRDVLC
jgi:anti-sigma factor ChrR (cupin superfamily)